MKAEGLKAEVVAIGDELVSGQRLDTNSCWLSQQLGELGIQTVRHTTVGDDLSDNIDALQQASHRADVVICTGGLGPTLDDLTRQAMADAFERPLLLDAASLEKITQLFSRRKRAMPPQNRVQAMFPQGSRVIPNPHGSAPGIDLAINQDGDVNCRFFALPGVPAEMKQMWVESVVPRLELLIGTELGPLRYHAIKVFGIGESDVEVKLPDLIERGRQPAVGITVSQATITLRIVGRGHTAADFNEFIQPTVAQIESVLGDLVFGQGSEELQHVVSRKLSEQRLKLATIEIGAASWIGDWMLGANQSPYVGGLVFPTLEKAVQWLGDADKPDRPPALDGDDALWAAIATQALERFVADVALVVGVYPSASEMENATAPFAPVFTLAIGDRVDVQRRSMAGHPDVLGPRIAKSALDLVRRSLATDP